MDSHDTTPSQRLRILFTIDYELYGDGHGSIPLDVVEPAERLASVFESHGVPFVVFVEAIEFDVIDSSGQDSSVDLVCDQIRSFYDRGFEIGLHIHPQWHNASFVDGSWRMDYNEYNLCSLPRERVREIVTRAVSYLRRATGDSRYLPFSFRAGNWLFQPSEVLSEELQRIGVRVDSSVFKGGRQRQNNLDYRRAIGNGPYWRFSRDVVLPDERGALLEIPVYTRMVPLWNMLTRKRINLQRKGVSADSPNKFRHGRRIRDFLRPRLPQKLDFCRMGFDELVGAVESARRDRSQQPDGIIPIVAIGHTKDLVDFETVERFLGYLASEGIGVSTFDSAVAQLP